MVARYVLGVAIAVAISRSGQAREPQSSPEIKKLAYMIGKFEANATTYSKDGKPVPQSPGKVECSWMLGGRYIRLVGLDNEPESEFIVGWSVGDGSYHAWLFTGDRGTPVELAGRVAGDRLVLTDAGQAPEAGIGVDWDSSKEKGPFMLQTVFKGMPADIAGLRVGDVLTELDGHPTSGLSLSELRSRILGREGTSVRLKARRGGQDREYTMKRKRLSSLQVRMTQRPRPGGGFLWTTEVKDGQQYRKASEGELKPLP